MGSNIRIQLEYETFYHSYMCKNNGQKILKLIFYTRHYIQSTNISEYKYLSVILKYLSANIQYYNVCMYILCIMQNPPVVQFNYNFIFTHMVPLENCTASPLRVCVDHISSQHVICTCNVIYCGKNMRGTKLTCVKQYTCANS